MTGGVGILRTEGGTESIYVLECKSIGLYIQLSAYGKIYRFAEEILCVIYFPSSVLGTLFMSRVVTWNISPAPSQSLLVIRGVCT